MQETHTPDSTPPSLETHAATALMDEKRRISLVWLIPLAALLVGVWLVYKTLSEQGPVVEIVFKSAEGIIAGKTQIKYKDVEVGLVDALEFSEDLKTVIVRAKLRKTMAKHLTDKTRFWVVTARLTVGKVSGLGTLLSGVYIGMDPGVGGEPAWYFKGLPAPPVITTDAEGHTFQLQAKSLGSLDIDSPVFYRRMRAGRVAEYRLNPDGQAVTVKILVEPPYDKLINSATRFWNASGVSATLDANGLRVSTESVTALMVGGIAFDTPESLEPRQPVGEDHPFLLFESLEATTAQVYQQTTRYVLYFSHSVRGLKIGAPVEFLGIQIGRVLDLKLVGSMESMDFRIPILIEVEPERMEIDGIQPHQENDAKLKETLALLVAKGFRGQLKTGSLLTGQLYVDLGFHPNAPTAAVTLSEQGYPIIPTVPDTFDSIKDSTLDMMARLEKLPIEDIAGDLRETIHSARQLLGSPELMQAIQNLNQTLSATRQAATQISNEVTPGLGNTLENTNQAVKTLDKTLGMLRQNVLEEDAQVYREIMRVLDELAQAARSIRLMADYLERRPDALIKGK